MTLAQALKRQMRRHESNFRTTPRDSGVQGARPGHVNQRDDAPRVGVRQHGEELVPTRQRLAPPEERASPQCDTTQTHPHKSCEHFETRYRRTSGCAREGNIRRQLPGKEGFTQNISPRDGGFQQQGVPVRFSRRGLFPTPQARRGQSQPGANRLQP